MEINHDQIVEGYARGGHVELVNKEIAAGASRDGAVLGYARSGYVAEVNQQIASGSVTKDYAVWGYACGGHVDQVNNEIATGASIHSAVEGYACGGYVEQVNQLIKQGARETYAVRGYAYGGHIEQVNQLIAKDGNLYLRDNAVLGYANGGFLVLREEVLRLLAYTNDEALRKLLSEEAEVRINTSPDDSKRMLLEATKLNHVMVEYQLSFENAKSITTKGVLTWLLQGSQLVNRGISADMFLEITAFVIGAPLQEAKKVLSCVNRKFFFDAVDNVYCRLKGGFFKPVEDAPQKYIAEHKQAEMRYQKRISF